jgi:alkylated DNA repair protein (DNA oxidative demethylase)
MRGVLERPDGLVYRPAVLDDREEEALLTILGAVETHAIRMRGQIALRTVRHYGYEYDYEALHWVRERAATVAGVDPEAFEQTLMTRYPPGSTIGWHRDAPIFGPTVAGVSLGAPCVMRFQRREGTERHVYELELASGSVYVLSGVSRSAWRHSIPPVPVLRYSLTFRTLQP